MNSCKVHLPLMLATLLTFAGCGGTTQPLPDHGNQSPAPAAEAEQKNGAENNTKGELEQLIDTVVEQTRSSMRTRTGTLKDVLVEVTPMWSLNYQGEVHIRVYDGAGNLILDEKRQ